MNVQALLHDSPPDPHRRRPDHQPWGTHPQRDPRDAPESASQQDHRRPIQPAPSPSSQSPAMASLRPLDTPLQAQHPAPPTQQSAPARRMPSPQPGIWGSDRSGSDFQKDRDLRDRPRDRLPPLLDQPRKKNIAMEVNGPLSGPGVPIPGPDDMAARSRSRRPSISGDPGKTDDELRGRESQQRAQERPLREPSREHELRDRDAWESEMYQRSRDRKARERDPYIGSYARPPAPEYRQPSGPGVPPTGDYRSGPPMEYRHSPGQPPPGRTTPQAELVVLKHSSGTAGPGVPGDRDRDRERERDRDRGLHPPYSVIGDRDREREWEREQERMNMGMMYPERDRDNRGPPPGMVSLPPPHGHSHSHSHGHPHHSHQHHHREPSGHSHSLHPVPHHQPPPQQHKGPPHPRHSHHVHHPQPQSSSQIQLLPHPHSHPPHSHPHPSQPQHPPSSQPHSPHPGQMHGGPPPPSHPVYRSQPPPPSSAPGPSGAGMSPHHHHHQHHHHPTPPSQQHHPGGPPPPQRQFQNQFHTQFIPGLPQPGSRMGSPVPSHPQQPPSQQQQQQQQQQRPQAPTQSAPPVGGGSGGGVPSSSASQPHIPPSSTLELPEAGINANKGSAMRLKKARVGAKTGGEQDRERVLDVERNGRRTYPDMDELEGADDAESDVGQAAATPAIVTAAAAEVEEWEEEEVKAKVKVHLGTFVYPKLPFPYFFDLGRGIELCEGKAEPAAVPSGEKEGEVVGKELDVKPQGEVEKESVEEKKGEVDGATVPVQKREDEMMDAEGEQQQKVDKTVLPAAPTITTAATTTVKEDPNLLDVETRVTVIIPNGFIPLEKPPRPRIWGGGLLDRMPPAPGRDNRRNARGNAPQHQHGRGSAKRAQRKQPTARPDDEGKPAPVSVAPRRRRRVYTDDSDLFLCALHAGWVTWSGAWAARTRGQDVRLDLRVLKCAGAPGGARWIESVVGREDVVGRFLGGWGERCFNEAGKVQKSRRKQVDGADGEDNDVGGDEEASDGEDDGRGLVSAAWGTTHDGSAIEVLGVEFVEKSTARSSLGVGLRNRAQRMHEYSERRANVLAPAATANGRSPLTRLPGRKRRRGCDWALSYPRRLPNAAVLDVIPEVDDEEEERGLAVDCDRADERAQMDTHTVVFRPGQTGFKYAPATLQELLFPGSAVLDSQPPKKRRKMEDAHDVDMLDADPDAQTHAPRRPIALLAGEERYLVSPCKAEQVLRDCKYDVSLLVVEHVEQTAQTSRGNPPEPPSLRLLQSGVGRASFQFLRDRVIVVAGDGEELRVPVVGWHWWDPVVD